MGTDKKSFNAEDAEKTVEPLMDTNQHESRIDSFTEGNEGNEEDF